MAENMQLFSCMSSPNLCPGTSDWSKGGQVKGTWKRTLAKEKAIVTLKLFTSLSRNPERALTRVVESYGHFLGVPAEMARA
jgi:hypothetical protein